MFSLNNILKNRFLIINVKSTYCGFTLAETLIILIVLGLVVSITIPNVYKRYKESLGRTKIKKSMTIYDYFISKWTVENDLKSGTALQQWASANNCENTTKYFKKREGDGCVFKTTDGVWLDISDILNPVIMLSDEAKRKYETSGKTDGIESFKMSASYDPITGGFRVNDLVFEQRRLEEELAYAGEDTKDIIKKKIEELQKLYNYLSNINTEMQNSNIVKDIWKQYPNCNTVESGGCVVGSVTPIYDLNSNNILGYMTSFEVFDDNGNTIAIYDGCDAYMMNCYQESFAIKKDNGEYYDWYLDYDEIDEEYPNDSYQVNGDISEYFISPDDVKKLGFECGDYTCQWIYPIRSE